MGVPSLPAVALAGAARVPERRAGAKAGALVTDAGLLLLVWLAIPVGILAVGTPVALLARLVINVATRAW